MASITRFVDHIGRVVLPKEYREKLGFSLDPKYKTKVRISEEDGKIIISLAEPICKLCGNRENVCAELELCPACITKIKAL